MQVILAILLINMFPFASRLNKADMRRTDTVVPSDGFMSSQIKADSPHILGRELGVHSQFKAGVSQIILVRSQEQMFWIHTRRVITAMADTETFRDGADPPKVRKAMGALNAVISPKIAIPRRDFRSRPLPAFIGRADANKAQEAFHGVSFLIGAVTHVGGSFILAQQKEGFSTRAPRWERFDHTSPIDDVRTRGVILRAEHSFGDCPVYPLLVVTCRGSVAGIMVALPGAAFSQDDPATTKVRAGVRLRWDRGAVVDEEWTIEPPSFAYPGWQGAPHLKQLEGADRLAVEFKLYGQGLVYGEFDLTDKEPALRVVRECK